MFIKFPPLFLLCFLLGISGFSQNRFEEGYYVDNNGIKKPTQVEYRSWTIWSNDHLRIKDKKEIKFIPLEELQGFGIDGKIKFIREEVEVERSSDFLKDFGRDPNPQFKKETVLLKVIVEGEYSLYLFLDGSAKKFFYRVNGGKITQLVRIKYMEGDGANKNVMENALYKKQLEKLRTCPLDDPIRYELNDLRRWFIKQNSCKGAELEFVLKRERKSRFGLYPEFGLNLSAGAIFNTVYVDRHLTSFELSGIAPSAIVELEMKIPLIYNEVNVNLTGYFNKVDFKDEVSFPNATVPREVTFSYSEIVVGAGGNYTYFLNNKSSVFAGLGIYMPIILEQPRYTESVSQLDITNSGYHLVPGIVIGYNYNKLILKAEVLFHSTLIRKNNNFGASLSRAALSLGYRLF